MQMDLELYLFFIFVSLISSHLNYVYNLCNICLYINLRYAASRVNCNCNNLLTSQSSLELLCCNNDLI